MELSLVIPVWNDPAGLRRLLAQVAEQDLFTQVIVVDDASDDPARTAVQTETGTAPEPGAPPPEATAATAPSATQGEPQRETPVAPPGRASTDMPGNTPGPIPGGLSRDRILWLHSDRRRGAGHARNMAMEHVTGSHVVFFDSDDLFSADFPRIAALAARHVAQDTENPFDFLIFRHDDSRFLPPRGPGGTFPREESCWQAAGAITGAGGWLSALAPAQAAILAGIAAYPWNKIYRTGFLRDNHIRCTEIMVHNDLELHWNSFLAARRILACSLSGAIHVVQDGGHRLTNRRSAERLAVFDAFAAIMDRFATDPMRDMALLVPFLRFFRDLLGWIRNNTDTAHHAALQGLARQHLRDRIDPAMMTLIAIGDPDLASDIIRIIRDGDLS